MKKLFFPMLVISLFVSCATTGTVWDDTIPPEQSAKIVFFYYEPTSYNGITINKKDFELVTIPAGTSEFVGDVAWWWYGGNTRYYFDAENAGFSCTLEGGKEYWAVVGYEYDEQKKAKIWGIRLFNDVIKIRIGFPDKDKIVGFIPFDPPVLSN
jgi:hypothetical protein